jgi:hypothetical protein
MPAEKDVIDAEEAGSDEQKPRDGRRIALAILEALAGTKTPTEAAADLGVSLTYYYTLETKALKGLVRACEPKPKGRQLTMERKLEESEKENDQLSLEIAPSPPAPRKKKVTKKKTGKRRKRATVRALKAADRLRTEVGRESEG